MRYFRLLPALLLLPLNGCLMPFEANVSHSARISAAAGASFIVEPLGAEDAGRGEYAIAAATVSTRLIERGYRPAADATHADLIVKMGYQIAGTTVTIPGAAWPAGQIEGTEIRETPPSGGAYTCPSCYGTEPTSYVIAPHGPPDAQVYASSMVMRINRRDSGALIFDGTVSGRSEKNTPRFVIDNLVHAMFARLPRSTGQRAM